MKSFMASPATIERKWYVVDATGYTLGRLASEVAKVLRGKFDFLSDCVRFIMDDDGESGRENYADWLNNRKEVK